MRGRSVICLCLVTMVGLLVASAASAASLLVPGGFRLEASNGYSLHALSYDGDPKGEHDVLLLFFSRKDSNVLYFARKGVEVTETSISADLGNLGSIELHFAPSGQPGEQRSACDQQQVEFDSGSYEGRIDFEGEEGFTKVHAASARGDLWFALNLICSKAVVEGFGGHSPGARLSTWRRWSHGKVEFEARKNSPTRPSRLRAEIDERRGNLLIARAVRSVAGPGAFEFDVPSQTARLRPPAPFAGVARFDRAGKQPGRLRGSLSVDFPGRSNVSLAGSRGGLERYVANPSHPFRPNVPSRLSLWPSTKPSPIAFVTPSHLAPK
jgi:hypothetical protein